VAAVPIVSQAIIIIIIIIIIVAGFLPRRPWFEPTSGHVGFAVDKVALGQVFSEYFGFPFHF
jgi:hypothetical protein